jgi:nickel/cobalt exporter
MDIIDLIKEGPSNPALLFGLAFVLGALHGLEPGHSKTMMAAFIIAVRGTLGQAVLLGLSAAFSHTIIVWILAGAALYWGDELIGEKAEPYFMAGSGIIIIFVAFWVFYSSRPMLPKTHSHGGSHSHGGEQPHIRAHAAAVESRFRDGSATTSQVVLFGLSGGLLPCAAAVTVLILCLHIQKIALGIGLVAGFSMGLAVVLVAVGSFAALGASALRKRSGRFDSMIEKAPYLSATIIAILGAYMTYSGWSHLP